MGKTSLAQAITERCELGTDKTISIYLSLEMVDLHHEGALYLSLALRLWRRFKDRLDKPEETEYTGSNVGAYFDMFLSDLSDISDGTQVVIVLDEFELLYKRLPEKAHNVIEYLRSLTQNHHWLALALVGLSDLEDLRLSYGSALLGWESIQVGFLDAEQVQDILINPPSAPDFPLSYTSDALQAVWQQTNGQPYLAQIIGHRLVQRYNRLVLRGQHAHNGIFDAVDVETVLTDPEFYRTAAAYFQGVWGQATKGQPGETAILHVLADYEQGLQLADLRQLTNLDVEIFSQSLDALLRHDVLCCTDDTVYYAVPLMRYWVRKNHTRNIVQAPGSR
jgi:hypothetical protein